MGLVRWRSGHEFGDGLEGLGLFVGGALGEASEAAFAALVVGDGFEEVDAAEVGPEAIGDEDLGVGDLPEEEVGDALLAGGADDEVGVRHVRGVEGAGDVGLVEGVECAGAEEVFDGAAAGVGLGGEVGEDGADGVYDFGAGAVVEGEGEGGAGVFGGGLHRPLHGVLDFLGEVVGAADVGHADVVVVHALDVAGEVALEELHEEADLGLGAAQVVFEREGVEGEEGKIDAGGGLDDVLDGFGALLVAEEALEGAFAGPAAIAVHDDGDVLGDSGWVELLVDRLLFGREFVDTTVARWGMLMRAKRPRIVDASTPKMGCAMKSRDRQAGCSGQGDPVEKTSTKDKERPREHPWWRDPSTEVCVIAGAARSGGAAPSGGQLADVVEEDRALEGVELRGVGRDLGEEGIRHEDGGLVAMAGVGVAQQGRDVDLEGPGETIQGGQGRHGFAVFDLGDVGARHVHPGGELTLREVAHVAQISNGSGYLKSAFGGWLGGDDGYWGWCGFRLFDLKRFAAAAAHQLTVRNCTRLQLSQRTTSRCSTGAIMVAISCVCEGTQSKDPHMSDNG